MAPKSAWRTSAILALEYRKDLGIETYVKLRRLFPEVEIQVGAFAGLDPLFALAEEFEKQGIDPDLIAGALDAEESLR